jgi:hypothetical protein
MKAAHQFSLSFALLVLGLVLQFAASRDVVPRCQDPKIVAMARSLWKTRQITSGQGVHDARLLKPVQEPISAAGGRVCSASLEVDGNPAGVIGYSVLSPSASGGSIVILE